DRGSPVLHVPGDPAAVHDVVPGADHSAGANEPAGGAAGVPHPVAGSLSGDDGRERAVYAAGVRAGGGGAGGGFGGTRHGQLAGGRGGRAALSSSRPVDSGAFLSYPGGLLAPHPDTGWGRSVVPQLSTSRPAMWSAVLGRRDRRPHAGGVFQ